MGELIGLKSKKCVPCEAGAEPLPESEVNRLCQQVGGWAGGRVGGWVLAAGVTGAGCGVHGL